MGLVLLLLLSVASPSAELAILSSGFSLHVDRHEKEGDTWRLYVGEGVIEIPAAEVLEFKFEEAVAEAAPVSSAPGAEGKHEPVEPEKTPWQLVEEAAVRYGIEPAFVHSVAQAESGYRTEARSDKGAIGVMQLMPQTAASLQADPANPSENVDAGVRHLRDLLLRYNGASGKALAAYNAGAGAVDKYGGIPPYQETRLYVERVLRNYWRKARKSEP